MEICDRGYKKYICFHTKIKDVVNDQHTTTINTVVAKSEKSVSTITVTFISFNSSVDRECL